MRPFTNGMTPPFTMIGEAVFKVLESKDENFPVGATILSKAGWILTGIIKVRVYLFRFFETNMISELIPIDSYAHIFF